jgi:ribosome biogenesis protein Nip4
MVWTLPHWPAGGGGPETSVVACQGAADCARVSQAPSQLCRLPQVARDKLVHLGACIGKLTHSGKFRLTVGALDILAQHARYKVGLRARQGRSRE